MADAIRWGILGTANIAKGHFMRAMGALDNSRAYAIASRDRGRAQQFATECGVEEAYGSYEELLSDPHVDAVYNPLPISLHAEWSIACAEAGKPCLCEKPLAPNAADAQRMVDTFREHDVPFAEAIMYRFHPLQKKVEQMIGEGAIGEVRVVRASFCCKIEDEDDIRFRAETGGGALLDVGSYCVSFVRHVVGEEPQQVGATADFGERGEVDESLAGTLLFPGGAVASLACSLRTEFASTYDIYGTDGRIVLPKGIVPNPGEEATLEYWQQYECEQITLPGADEWALAVEDFADALLEGRPPATDPQDGVRSLEVIDSLLAAARA
ncbi:MAG: Gfo/Idh/MocA family oxidoreductase [Candidatus Brocadiia bacterium]